MFISLSKSEDNRIEELEKEHRDLCEAFDNLKSSIEDGVKNNFSYDLLRPMFNAVTPLLNSIDLIIKEKNKIFLSKKNQSDSWFPYNFFGLFKTNRNSYTQLTDGNVNYEATNSVSTSKNN